MEIVILLVDILFVQTVLYRIWIEIHDYIVKIKAILNTYYKLIITTAPLMP